MPRQSGESRVDLLQGTLDLLILETLRWGSNHGYGITQVIRTQSGDLLRVDTGSLYPALHRLEQKGLVRAEWKISDNKQRTRVYRLTPAGRRQLVGERSRWRQFSSAVASILNRVRENPT
jgi:PadR family transcriptional regulator PadR